MIKSLRNIGLAAGIVILAAACGGDTEPKPDMTIDESAMPDEMEISTSDKVQFQRAKIVLFSLPSPMETAKVLKKSGAIYDSKYLNSVDRLDAYETSQHKAIGMGMYIADLSYANVFKQQQACMDYFAAINDLANEISLSEVFTQDFIERVDENISEEDSVLKYLTEAYWKANMELKEDDRESVAGLLAAGGWMEGMYIATHLINPANPSDVVAERIAEQGTTLKQLLKFLMSFKDDKNLHDIIQDLERVEKLFDKVEVETIRTESTKDENGISTVGKKKVYTFPNGLLEEIIKTSHEIRNKYA